VPNIVVIWQSHQ